MKVGLHDLFLVPVTFLALSARSYRVFQVFESPASFTLPRENITISGFADLRTVELNKPQSGNCNCLQWQRFKLLELSKT